MSLYQEWKDLMDAQTEETIQEFWKEYSGAEMRIYSHILENKDTNLSGTISKLAKEFECSNVIFMGFLDGINTSLKTPLDLENLKATNKVTLDIDMELLFLNMLKAEADYLFNLEQWDNVLTREKRLEIYNEFKKSKTVRATKKPGRNEPCPCGSGKKYKKCCGAN